MTTRLLPSCAFLALLTFATPLASQEPAPKKSREDLEAEFGARLTGVRLVGFTTLDGVEGLKEDSYTIRRATKQEDGRWRFEAQIEFGGTPVPIAMALPVEWAGDTPVISVDDLKFPMMGSYTARVLFHGDQYVGVWTGKEHGGQMFGRIEPLPAEQDTPVGEEPEQEEDGGGGAPSGAGASTRGDDSAGNWPSFRGAGAAGVVDTHVTPETWEVASGKNVKWRTELPGLAHSSPVIFGDRIFVTTAIRAEGEQDLRVGLYGDIAPVQDASAFAFVLYCLDKKTGEIRWEQVAWEGVPAVKRHTKGSHAASTPAVDAERVVAFFATEGLFCYDHEGELQWSKDFGLLDSGY